MSDFGVNDPWPWPAGAATGLGSLPGTDIAEALRIVVGELPGLPHLPELPARGPGADMIGRTAAFLVDLPVEIAPSGWRMADHASRDLRRARDFLDRDLDAVVELAGSVTSFKVQAAGPWTLAANVELWTGHAVLADHGARRDMAESLADGLRTHVADVRRRLPAGARVVLQLDEPSLPAVQLGRVPTPSGYGSIAAVDEPDLAAALRSVFEAAGADATVLHCCAADPPLALLGTSGTDAISVDVVPWSTGSSRISRAAELDALGELVDAGRSLWLGVLPAVDTVAVDADLALSRARSIWNSLGFAPRDAGSRIVPTPSCGLAGATPKYARQVLRALTKAGQQLAEHE